VKGKHVLITGHTGFKGSWLTAMLHTQSARVSGIALDPPAGGIFERAKLHELLEHDIRQDIRDGEGLTTAFQKVSPDLVIHLAAQPLVLTGHANPIETFETNVMGTFNVLQAAKVTSTVQATLVITTDKVYAQKNGSKRAFEETDSLGAADPYSTSKAMADLLTQSWITSNPSMKVAIARAGNVIGGGYIAENRLLPDLVKAFENSEIAIIRNPESIRPWQHVLDCISGYILLSQAILSDSQVGGAYNFGPPPEDPLKVFEVADITAGYWGSDAKWTSGPSEKLKESDFLTLDSKKARTLLGWKDKLSPEEAIKWTVEWHKEHFSAGDTRTPTMKQISAYLKL
jgi:CDP-glucose 4,6-dehydratase